MAGVEGIRATIDPDFLLIAERLAQSCQVLQSCPVEKCRDAKVTSGLSGIYVFSEDGKNLYVGRSEDVAKRLELHRCGADNQATFAFRLAREATGNLKPTYMKLGSRKDLMTREEFREAFASAKQRISMMDVRVVEERDSVRQALLEIYVAIVLKTPYNDFNTT
jgi:predicted GIY-YIG superfamily endonuclease